MGARITINLTSSGEFEIWLNKQGRDLLVEKLLRLDSKNDHIHLGPKDVNMEVDVSTVPYRRNDKILEYGKILFRTDEWDREYFPHVMTD